MSENPILTAIDEASMADPEWARDRMFDALTTDERAPEAMRCVVRAATPAAREAALATLTAPGSGRHLRRW